MRARDPLAAEEITAPSLSAAGDAWAVIDGTDGDVWLRGADAAVSTPTTGAVIAGQADAEGTAVYLADETSLVRVPTDGSEVTTEVGDGASVLGTPAQPTTHDGAVFAAWLPQGTQDGVLWSSRAGRSVLDYGERGAARPATTHVRRERRRDDPERDADGLGVDRPRRRARRLQPELVAR